MRGGLSLEAGASHPQQAPYIPDMSVHKPALEMRGQAAVSGQGFLLAWERQGTLSQRS